MGLEGDGLRVVARLLLATALAATASARAQPEREISDLLSAVRSSRCSFERNGEMFSGSQAADHLTRKARSVENESGASAEGFIESAGTASSVSGRPYRVHCAGEPTLASSRWLTRQLEMIRLKRTKAAANQAQ